MLKSTICWIMASFLFFVGMAVSLCAQITIAADACGVMVLIVLQWIFIIIGWILYFVGLVYRFRGD